MIMQQVDMFDRALRAANIGNGVSFAIQSLYTLGTYLHYFFPNVFDFINGVTFYNYSKNDKIEFKDQERFRDVLAVENEKLKPNDYYLKLLNIYLLISLSYKLDACYFTGSQKSNIYTDLENLNDTQYCFFTSHIVDNIDRLGNIDTCLNFLTVFYPKENVFVVSFNGSNSIKKWVADFMIEKSMLFNPKDVLGATKRPILFHHGFVTILNTILSVSASQFKNSDFGVRGSIDTTISDFILSMIKTIGNEETKTIFIGHSLGATLATIVFLKLQTCLKCNSDNRADNVYLYSYGCPKFCNMDFETEFDLDVFHINLNKMVFVVNDNDIVTKLPPLSHDYYQTYVTAFPSRQLRLQNGSQSSYFNVVTGILNHTKYASILAAYYKNTLRL